jgi:hypothetical protein
MRALLDVNMLLALTDPRHVAHSRARSWRAAQLGPGRAHDGWASCPLTQNGFLRVVTQPKYTNPVEMGVALDLLRRMTGQADHQFWADDLSLLESDRIDHRYVLGQKYLSDIYLLALAVRHGGRLITLDREISRRAVHGASEAQLVIV